MEAFRTRGGMGRGSSVTRELTFSLDTSAYAANDVLADRQEITNVLREVGLGAVLTDLVILDKDDNTAAAMDVYFLNADVALGTENAAISITDANAEYILGVVSIAAGDWKDLINSKLAHIRNINMVVKGVSGSTSIYVALVTAGTPTQTASGIVGRFKFIQD